jgi:hypothetical protein
MLLTIMLLLTKKENWMNEMSTHYFGICQIALPFAQPIIPIQFLSLTFSHDKWVVCSTQHFYPYSHKAQLWNYIGQVICIAKVSCNEWLKD